jgi:hypothetical protein
MNWGLRVIITGFLPELRTHEEISLHTSRHGSVFALSCREHLLRVIAVNLRSHLLALFAPKSGEGLPKIGINARGMRKRMVEHRHHCCLCVVVVSYECRCI